MAAAGVWSAERAHGKLAWLAPVRKDREGLSGGD